jgi:hypothetical protein
LDLESGCIVADVSEPIVLCTSNVVSVVYLDTAVVVGELVTTLDDNSFRWSPEVTVGTISESDHGQYATVESMGSQAMLDTLITLPVLPARSERTATVTVTDSGGNIAQCTASVYVRAPVMTPSDASIAMTTLTTSSTRRFDLTLTNTGEVRAPPDILSERIISIVLIRTCVWCVLVDTQSLVTAACACRSRLSLTRPV